MDRAGWQAVPLEQQAVPAQQCVPQARGVVPPQPQLPPEQVCPAAQACPHVPQLFGSVWVLTQALALGHQVWPVGQQFPLEHAFPAMHDVVQSPQCALSVDVFTHTGLGAVPQLVGYAPPHAHAPAVQVEWFWQTCPHAPQFDASTRRLTHRGSPPQSNDVSVPLQTQVLAVHAATGVAPTPLHASPHVLQLSGSIVRSTHSPRDAPHVAGSDGGHAQVPAAHAPPVGHR